MSTVMISTYGNAKSMNSTGSSPETPATPTAPASVGVWLGAGAHGAAAHLTTIATGCNGSATLAMMAITLSGAVELAIA